MTAWVHFFTWFKCVGIKCILVMPKNCAKKLRYNMTICVKSARYSVKMVYFRFFSSRQLVMLWRLSRIHNISRDEKKHAYSTADSIFCSDFIKEIYVFVISMIVWFEKYIFVYFSVHFRFKKFYFLFKLKRQYF